MTPYCGKCHKWLDDGIPGRVAGAVCECRNPDLTKDPNCHNSGHDHHDPESPILKMDRQVRAVEDAIEQGRNHEWSDYENQYCTHCGVYAAGLEGDAWVYCPARTPKPKEETYEAYITPLHLRWRGHFNWKDVAERVVAGILSGLAAGAAFWLLHYLVR